MEGVAITTIQSRDWKGAIRFSTYLGVLLQVPASICHIHARPLNPLRYSELLESKSSQKDPSQWDTAFQAASVHSHWQHTMGSALSYQNIYVCMQDTGTPPTQREVMRKFGPRATGYVNWQYKGGGVWESGRQKEICYEWFGLAMVGCFHISCIVVQTVKHLKGQWSHQLAQNMLSETIIFNKYRQIHQGPGPRAETVHHE